MQGCGKLISTALACCGFGDQLLEAARSLDRDELEKWLVTWRGQVRDELRMNKSGLIGSKKPALAKKIPDDFPNLEILLSYTNPITSETEGKSTCEVTWEREPDIGKIAGLCELYFEWGVKDIIVKRFRTVLWPSVVLRILRRSVMEKDEKKRKGLLTNPKKSGTTGKLAPGTPSKMITKYFSSMKLNSPNEAKGMERQYSDGESEAEEDRLIVKIHSSRQHASMDGILEYRLEVAPSMLVRLAESGIQGIRPPIKVDAAYDSDTKGADEDEDEHMHRKKGKKPPPDPESHIRVWMPACMVEIVEPELVKVFEEIQVKKLEKKAKQSDKTEGGKKGLETVERHDQGTAPRPFLMSDPFVDPKDPVCASVAQQSSLTPPKKRTKSSSSESFRSCITKSLRKSPWQTSPRSGLTLSPTQPAHRFDDIAIDISSDSDVPSGEKPCVVKSRPPVLEQTLKGKSQGVVMVEDVIDLT